MRGWLWCVGLLAACASDEPTATDDDLTDTNLPEDTDTDVPSDTDTDLPEDTDVPTPCEPSVMREVGVAAPLVYTTTQCWTVRFTTGQSVKLTTPDTTDSIEVWGIGEAGGLVKAHENVNGKHIKDTMGTSRTILVPGGIVLTMHIVPKFGGVGDVSVHDVGVSYRFDALTLNEVDSTTDPTEVASREAAEADGEASEVKLLAGGVLRWDNVYNQDEDENGVPLDKVPNEQPLAETGGNAYPNNVTDYYDDPNLEHT